jgi:hypothetical protein
MASNKPHDLGDVHAPVEDTEVPVSLKLLVVILLILLGTLGVVIGVAVSRFAPLLLNG